jgi:FdhD protein
MMTNGDQTDCAMVSVFRVGNGGVGVFNNDLLAVEEPLEIRLGFTENNEFANKSISITMRTPGGDRELAVGFLFTEGIVSSKEEIRRIAHCGAPDKTNDLRRNTIRIDLASGVTVDYKKLERHFYTSSSCGVCGKSSIEALQTGARKIEKSDFPRFSPETIHRLPERLRYRQTVFERTGAIHAAGLFDTEGNLIALSEDVGRHNAVDKVIGGQFLAGNLPLSDKLLMVSGRASFELVQKALMAGIPILAAVGAPSSLAVELAREFGMTVLGFVRDNHFNVYCGAERIEGLVNGKTDQLIEIAA